MNHTWQGGETVAVPIKSSLTNNKSTRRPLTNPLNFHSFSHLPGCHPSHSTSSSTTNKTVSHHTFYKRDRRTSAPKPNCPPPERDKLTSQTRRSRALKPLIEIHIILSRRGPTPAAAQARVPRTNRPRAETNPRSAAGARPNPHLKSAQNLSRSPTRPPSHPACHTSQKPAARARTRDAVVTRRARACASALLPSAQAQRRRLAAAASGFRASPRRRDHAVGTLIEGALDCGFKPGRRAVTGIRRHQRLRCRTTPTAGWEASGPAGPCLRRRLRR